MSGFPYELAETDGLRARLGLIVLQVDETIERDFRRLLPDEVALYTSRIPSGLDLTEATIARMAEDLSRAAALFPPAVAFDAVGYGCTSGTTLIGAARVADLVRAGCETGSVCDPLGAGIAAFRQLGIGRIGLVSPYTPDIAGNVRRAFEAAEIAVPAAITFGERIEANVARIAPRSVAAACREVARRRGVEGIFLSCTNLRTLDLVGSLQREFGRPVLGSNLALAWRMVSAALPDRDIRPGDLIETLARRGPYPSLPAQS